VSTSDVELRETAWLTTSGDSLPALLTAAGGPWDIVQAFDPVARRRTQATSVYVMARHIEDQRVSNQRIRAQYAITLELTWPVKRITPPIAEGEFQALKDAADLILQRVRGLVGDKTHGGRFLSVGEAGGHPVIDFGDPFAGITEHKAISAVISYRADDYEISG
jgi:hypothetical protein